MAILKNIWIIILCCQIFLLESFVEATQSSRKDAKINDSLAIGIFIGIWIGIACYTVIGWIVDISRKRHVFCKRPTSDKPTHLYNYATTESSSVELVPRYTDVNDLNREEGSDPRNHSNSYTESLYVDMSKKRNKLKTTAFSSTHGDSKYIDMSNKHGKSNESAMSNTSKQGNSLYIDMSNKHGDSQYTDMSNKHGDSKYMDMNGIDNAAYSKGNDMFVDVRL